MNNPKTDFEETEQFKQLSVRNLAVAREIAASVISWPIQEQISTIQQLASQHGIGFGTVQKILSVFEEAGAIHLEARGHQGTFLISKNISLLCKFIGNKTIIGAMPLPSTKEFRLVAAAIRAQFDKFGLPFNFIFLDGAKNRLDLLKSNRCDFTLMSEYAADSTIKAERVFSKCMVFDGNSYHRTDSVVVLTRNDIHQLSEIKQVGIDRTSPDHEYLTSSEFSMENVNFIEGSYLSFPDMILDEIIDGTIWHSSTLNFPIGYNKLRILSLTHNINSNSPETLSRTAVVKLSSDQPIENVLHEILDDLNLEQIESDLQKSKMKLVF
jgi:hypothetical protein